MSVLLPGSLFYNIWQWRMWAFGLCFDWCLGVIVSAYDS